LKVEFEGRVGNFDVYRLETDKPASEVVNLFENVFRDLVRDSLALTVSSGLVPPSLCLGMKDSKSIKLVAAIYARFHIFQLI